MLTAKYFKDVLPNPKKTVQKLDQYIIGQKDAKYTLALMLLNQSLLKLHSAGKLYLPTKLNKTNVLLIGPTGTGKTALIKALSEMNQIPISINDITTCTAAGYIGGKVEDILVNHIVEVQDYANDNYNRLKIEANILASKTEFIKEIAETGIIYLDEIDKIRRRSSGDNIDVNGDMVQNELLKLLEDGNISLASARQYWKSKYISSIKTDNIIFICGGAFEGLDEIISKRLGKNDSIGFTSDLTYKSLKKGELLKHVTTEDLIAYGFKPEFLGRVPLRAVLSPISPKMMEKIILEPKNSVFSQYAAILNSFGIDVDISKSAIQEIAMLATEMGMGARALKPIFSKLFEDVFFNIWDIKDNTTYVITKRDVQKLYGSI